MPGKYSNAAGTLTVPLIQQPIATVQDDQYPAVEHRLDQAKVQVRFRDSGFVRHQFQGLNIFLLEMFSEFMKDYKTSPDKNFPYNDVLGVRQNDYMLTVQYPEKNMNNDSQAPFGSIRMTRSHSIS